MPQRKVWNQQEDKILKYLKEEQGQTKWSVIARKMQSDFGIPGRTGKQCRERYRNHLDNSILITSWSKAEEQILLQMHEEVGNKWSAIAHKLPGRSENCVKNHFYSKMRKSIRRLNKLINESLQKEYRQIKISTMYDILQICQNSFENNSKYDEQFIEHCQSKKNKHKDIKKQLYVLDSGLTTEPVIQEDHEKARQIIIELIQFQNKHKKGGKSTKQHKDSASTVQLPIKQQPTQVKIEESENELYWILKRVCQEYLEKQQ